jgi:hypothetical protein
MSIGNQCVVRTDMSLTPFVLSEYDTLYANIKRLMETNKFGSTLYKSLAGPPKLTWFIPMKSMSEVSKLASHPLVSASQALSAGELAKAGESVSKAISNVSSQFLVLDGDAGDVPKSSPIYLYQTVLGLKPGAAYLTQDLKTISEAFAECHKSAKVQGYSYKSLIGPTFEWYLTFESLSDLDSSLTAFNKAVTKQADNLESFYSQVTRIDSFILKKVEEK